MTLAQRTLLIFTEFRSGSNLLCSYLENSGLGHPAEHFQFLTAKEVAEVPVEETCQRILERIEEKTDESGTYAVKMNWQQMTALGFFLRKLSGPEMTVQDFFPNAELVYLERKDTLAQAISLWRAEVTGEWFRPEKGEPKVPEKYDYMRISHLLRELALAKVLWPQYFAAHGLKPTHLTYEEDLLDPAHIEHLLRGLWKGEFEEQAFSIQSKVRKQADAFSAEIKERFWRDCQNTGATNYWREQNALRRS